MTRLDTPHTKDWNVNEELAYCDERRSTAVQATSDTSQGVDCSTAALSTARQLLVDRAEADKALDLLERRKRQLNEQQKNFLDDTEGSSAEWDAPKEFHKKHENFASQKKVSNIVDPPLYSSQLSRDSPTGLYDALTTDRTREIFRRLMVVREVASRVSVSLKDGGSVDEASKGHFDVLDRSGGIFDLKRLQESIDQRETFLQRAEEAVQSRAALRKVEDEHAKALQKKHAEFEEQRKRFTEEANEQLVKQQQDYEQQLAKERERCVALRKELDLQAKELDLQRRIEEERIQEQSKKEYRELEEELLRLREQHRETESQLQRCAAEAAQQASALKSAVAQERDSFFAAAQAAERRATEALNLVQEKEREVKLLEEKLKQAQAQQNQVTTRPPAEPSLAAENAVQQVGEKVPFGPSSALSEPSRFFRDGCVCS